jgi:malonyl-CoA/methylmalonyl-CoA synthetase
MSAAAEPMLPGLDSGHGARAALVFPEAQLSYEQLGAASAGVACELVGHSRVAVWAEPTAETCVAVVGALRAGVPVVPLNPRSGTRELAHIFEDAQPEAVLVGPGAEVPDPARECPLVEVDLSAAANWSEPSHDPEVPALIVYTSGTTGPPKGAVLPRRAISSNLDALAAAWAWSGQDVVAHGLPLFHVHGLVIGVLGPLRRGGTVHHLGRFSTDATEEALRSGATMVFGVPTMYRRLAEAAEHSPELARGLAAARLLISGSAALPAAEHASLESLTGRGVLERYGMTETLMNTAIPASAPPAPGAVGPSLPGVELRLVDEEGQVLEADDGATMGEIEVRGPNLFLGYLNRPRATAQAMRDGWFRTGDLATRDDRGYIRIVGRRATDLIKSGGYKIGAGEIEAALREHPAVEDAAVTAEEDPDLGERIVAWVVRRSGHGASAADVSPEALIDHVAEQLAPHKRPREVRFLDELPRNELGKVQKQRLSG